MPISCTPYRTRSICVGTHTHNGRQPAAGRAAGVEGKLRSVYQNEPTNTCQKGGPTPTHEEQTKSYSGQTFRGGAQKRHASVLGRRIRRPQDSDDGFCLFCFWFGPLVLWATSALETVTASLPFPQPESSPSLNLPPKPPTLSARTVFSVSPHAKPYETNG